MVAINSALTYCTQHSGTSLHVISFTSLPLHWYCEWHLNAGAKRAGYEAIAHMHALVAPVLEIVMKSEY